MSDFSDSCPKGFPQGCPKKFTKKDHDDFPESCPPDCLEDCAVKRFNDLSEQIVANYKNAPTLRPPRNVERDLDRLRRLLSSLEPDVREVLISRECEVDASAEQEEFFKMLSDTMSEERFNKLKSSVHNALKFQHSKIMLFPNGSNKDTLNGGSALEKLERFAAAPFQWPIQRDGLARANLIKMAKMNYESCGEEISKNNSCTARSPFVEYLEVLAIEAGIDTFEAPKAVRDFFDRKT